LVLKVENFLQLALGKYLNILKLFFNLNICFIRCNRVKETVNALEPTFGLKKDKTEPWQKAIDVIKSYF
jgi:hypothetical protein